MSDDYFSSYQSTAGMPDEFAFEYSSALPLTAAGMPSGRDEEDHLTGGYTIKQENMFEHEHGGYAYPTADDMSMGMDTEFEIGAPMPSIGDLEQQHDQPAVKYQQMQAIEQELPTADIAMAPVPIEQPIAQTPALSNAHLPSRSMSKNATPQPPMTTSVRTATVVKREPISPSSIASTAAIVSPPLAALVVARPSSGSSSAGSNSGGSAMASDASSDSDSEQEVDTKRKPAAKGKKSNSPATRKRKAKASSESDQADSSLLDDAMIGNGSRFNEDGVECDMTGVPLTGDKRQQRLQRNRASAQLSRERKKQYMKLLERQLKEMSEINTDLTTQVTALTTENAQLKARLSKLAMRERVANRYPARPPMSSSGASQASSSAASSMPSLSHNSPLNSHAGSDADSAFSVPTTPQLQQVPEDDLLANDYPRAKKLKVAAYNSNSTQSPVRSASGGFNARTGMLLFTLVCSTLVLVNLAGGGLDSGLVSVRGPSPAVLEPIDEVVAAVPTPSAAAHVVTMAPRGRVLASIAEQDEDAFALVPVAASQPMEVDSTTTTINIDSKALDVYANQPSKQQQAREQTVVITGSESVRHLLATPTGVSSHGDMLRQLLLAGGNNFTGEMLDEASKYLFAPSAVRITRSLIDGLMNADASRGTPSEMSEDADEKQLTLFDRSKRGTKRQREARAAKITTAQRLRNRLPALPAPDAYDAVDHEMSTPPLQVGDQLLLWVPQQTVGANAILNASEVKANSMVEIACQIAQVRPISLQ
jgi:hypothetical protein